MLISSILGLVQSGDIGQGFSEEWPRRKEAHLLRLNSWLAFCLRWHLVFILKMSDSRAGTDIRGSHKDSTIFDRFCSFVLEHAYKNPDLVPDQVEASSEERFQNVIGQHVSKRFAELTYEGVVESHDNESEMFKVMYSNGHSEEMKWEDLMKYLVPHEQPALPYSNKLPNGVSSNDEAGEGLVVALAPPTRKHRQTKKMSSLVQLMEATDKGSPSRQAGTGRARRSTRNGNTSGMKGLAGKNGTSGMMRLRPSTRNDDTSGVMKLKGLARNDENSGRMKLNCLARNDEASGLMRLRRSTRKDESSGLMRRQHSTREDEALGRMSLRRSTRKNEASGVMRLRRSSRKRKQIRYSYCEETTDEDEEDEPNYPLPPIIQVPWADMGENEDENQKQVPTRGLCTSQGRGKSRRAKKHWVSLRICASSYPHDGRKIAADDPEGSEH